MFHCQNCGRQQPRGVSPTMITTQTRQTVYEPREKVHPTPFGSVDDPGGHGFEIVREIRVGACCASAEQREEFRVSAKKHAEAAKVVEQLHVDEEEVRMFQDLFADVQPV